jgi:branched-chain amino acid transport system substrate-binding protein
VLENSYFSNSYSAEVPRTAVQDWVKKYKAKYNAMPDSIATMAYDATNLMLEGIKKAGSDDPAKVKDVLASIEFEGVTGKIKFDSSHNPVKPAAVLHVKDGKVVFEAMVTP